MFYYLMDLHYSQTIAAICAEQDSFTTLWIYTILKRMTVRSSPMTGFTTLWIYTILKQGGQIDVHRNGFTTLWIYTILKLCHNSNNDLHVSLPYGFTLFSNEPIRVVIHLLFHYLMDLHYSQTATLTSSSSFMFHYLMDLHYSQTPARTVFITACFTTLWIYTILKRSEP